MSDEPRQLILLPYIGLRNQTSIRYGRVEVWPQSMLDDYVTSEELRTRIQLLLNSYKASSFGRRRSEPLLGIGLVSVGARDFRPLAPTEIEEVHEFRHALFLSTLASNVTWSGPNAGHYMHTAENFSLVTQNFQLAGDYLSETSGMLVTVTNMGLKLGEVEFTTPTHVPRPLQFSYETDLMKLLWRLRRRNRQLYRRILNAVSVFIESYYNTPSVDIRARVLLQATAFEVLLDLPDTGQRREFKNLVEQLCGTPGERKYRYKFEAHSKRVAESRTLKAMWADRFYTLRNHIIHGKRIRNGEYRFRGHQHHLVIAPMFFVLAAKKLVKLALPAELPLFDRIDWERLDDSDEDDSPTFGFKIGPDLGAMVEHHMRKAGII